MKKISVVNGASSGFGRMAARRFIDASARHTIVDTLLNYL